MTSTFLWEAIQSLSSYEMGRFRLFVASPYFNKREDVKDLLSYLADCRLHKKMPEEWAACEAIGLEDASPFSKLRLVQTYLFRLMQAFLIRQRQEGMALQNSSHLLSQWRERRLPRHFQKSVRQTSKQLEEASHQDPEYYLYRYHLLQEQLRMEAQGKRTKALSLQPVEDSLSIAMVSMKLRQACLLRSHENVFGKTYDTALLPELLSIAGQTPFAEVPAVQLYRYCYLSMQADADTTTFQRFQQLLFEHGQLFPPEELRDLYLYAINYCIKKINAGEKLFLRAAFDLYREGISSETLMEQGQLSHFTFNNTVGIGIGLKEFDWIEQFIQQYASCLPEQLQDQSYQFGMARLAFEREHYGEALQHLQKADYQDLIHSMTAKILQLKIYYELEEYDLLETQLSALHSFLRRRRNKGYHQQNWKNILRFIKQLMHCPPHDRQRRQQLRERIEQAHPLTEKAWLLDKV